MMWHMLMQLFTEYQVPESALLALAPANKELKVSSARIMPVHCSYLHHNVLPVVGMFYMNGGSHTQSQCLLVSKVESRK